MERKQNPRWRQNCSQKADAPRGPHAACTEEARLVEHQILCSVKGVGVKMLLLCTQMAAYHWRGEAAGLEPGGDQQGICHVLYRTGQQLLGMRAKCGASMDKGSLPLTLVNAQWTAGVGSCPFHAMSVGFLEAPDQVAAERQRLDQVDFWPDPAGPFH